MIKKILASIFFASVSLSLAGCSETAGSGKLVPIPQVTFSCGVSNCIGAAPNSQYRVIYSSFGCQGAGSGSFSAVAINTNTNLNCSGASCTGATTQAAGATSVWVDEHGFGITQIPAGSYSICIVLFRHGTITTGPTSQDAYAEVSSVTIDSNSPASPISVSNFVNGAATFE